jgi:L-2,4-diaminobutyric acid acetyltransferase
MTTWTGSHAYVIVPDLVSTPDEVTLRRPDVRDAAAIWRLVRRSGALDVNSPYAYLLLTSHFADTSIVAEWGGDVVGFVAAYRPPSRLESLFVWQVAVDAAARGHGLGTRLLDGALATEAAAECRYLEATVTPSNASSWALFRGVARRRGVPGRQETGFEAALFPDGGHEDEILVRIGPLTPAPARGASEPDGKEVPGCR